MAVTGGARLPDAAASGRPAPSADASGCAAASSRSTTCIDIGPMCEADLDEVLAIERRVYPCPWSRELFWSELFTTPDHAPRRYVVARRRDADDGLGVVVGYAGVLVLVDEAHVTTVAVDPRQHRRGAGTRLLATVLEAGRRLGATAATLEVRVGNRGAQRLYAQLGFAPVGVRPGYYDDTGEDALIMWLHGLASDPVTARLDALRARCAAPGGREVSASCW